MHGAAAPALGRRHRRQPAARHDRAPVAGRHPRRRVSAGRGLRRATPRPTPCSACPRTRASATSRTASTSRWSPCPPTACSTSSTSAPRQGVHGLVVVSAGFAESGAATAGAAASSWCGWPGGTGMRVIGPNSSGVINADPEVRLNASLAPSCRRRPAWACSRSAARWAWPCSTPAGRRGIGVSDVRLRRQPRRRLRQRPHAVLGGRRQHRRRGPLPGVHRQPAQVLPDRPRLARRKPVIVVKSGSSAFGVPPGHAVRPTPRAAGGVRRDAAAGRLHPGGEPTSCSTSRSWCSTSRCRPAAGRRRRQQRRARRAHRAAAHSWDLEISTGRCRCRRRRPPSSSQRRCARRSGTRRWTAS